MSLEGVGGQGPYERTRDHPERFGKLCERLGSRALDLSALQAHDGRGAHPRLLRKVLLRHARPPPVVADQFAYVLHFGLLWLAVSVGMPLILQKLCKKR